MVLTFSVQCVSRVPTTWAPGSHRVPGHGEVPPRQSVSSILCLLYTHLPLALPVPDTSRVFVDPPP